MLGHNVIVNLNLSRVRVSRERSNSATAKGRSQLNHSRDAHVSLRVLTIADFHIDVSQGRSTVSTPLSATAHGKLAVTLNHRIIDVNRITTHPVDPIAGTVCANVHVLQPT